MTVATDPIPTDDDLLAWMDATATTGLVVRADGDVVRDLRRPLDGDGWYGLDGAAHHDASDGIGLPFRRLDGGLMAHDVASAQKSVIAVLVAAGVDRGVVRIDDPVTAHLGDGWSRATPAQEGAITLRHLLTMTSGLDDELAYVAPPGTRWWYSLGPAWHLLKPVLVAAAERSLTALTAEWLGDALDWEHTTWIDRPGMSYLDGTPFEALSTTAPELARFGELVLRHGSWGGEQVVSAEGITGLLTPSQDLNPAYGMLWWLNGHRPHLLPLNPAPIDRVLLPGAPDDLVCALGAMGQICAVAPSRQLVVVRLGGADPRGGADRFTGASLAADLVGLVLGTGT